MTISDMIMAYRLRWKRRRFLYRAWRKRGELTPVVDRLEQIKPQDILAFSTVRNEMLRLPWFLEHHRRLGVGHFFFVDNDSTDGTRDYLADQGDVSLWSTSHSYKLSRFGMDWLTWLMTQYAHGHWTLTLDADETFIYPHYDRHPLPDLAAWLDQRGWKSFGALMLDLYPKGALDRATYNAGDDPTKALAYFDADNYRRTYQKDLQNVWIQGGVRSRVFFADEPRRAPTLNKIPFVKWDWRYAYVTSTHKILPRRLNHALQMDPNARPSGVLLHSKFLPNIGDKSAEELTRRQHFENSDLYTQYYQSLINAPDLWYPQAKHYINWQDLVEQGLMSTGPCGEFL